MAKYARQWQVRNNVVNEDANTEDMSNEDVREMFAFQMNDESINSYIINEYDYPQEEVTVVTMTPPDPQKAGRKG